MKEKCKNPLTDSRTLSRGLFTGRERRFERNGPTAPVANIDGQQSPGHKIGDTSCPPLTVGGSLTLSVLDEGTCGRRRLLPGLQGSGWQLN
uniref:Uncharacterized protein n=1 Tax=uncultured bacterium 5H7 TaxID=1701327 RepID=A0A0N9HTV1_9BACT|nr:hypothetical protein 5H7_022 [uncultured bacterium 5H7]